MASHLGELWGWIAGGLGSGATALLVSHSRVRDRVARLEIQVHELAEDVSKSTERIASTHDAVVRLEASAAAAQNASEQTLRKLDALYAQASLAGRNGRG